MSKTYLCRRCAHQYGVRPDTEYGSIECPKCRLRPAQVGQKLVAGFTANVQPPQTSRLYRLGIVLVTVLMVLLPVVYVALIATVMYLLYMHATHWGLPLFAEKTGPGKNDQLKLIIFGYFAPLIAGGVLLLFMLKPLLAARPKGETSRRLEKEDEPVLFDFVSRLCEAVGAPVPAEIRIDGRVNASAGFRAGRMAIFSKQLVLTIGAPLVAGLTLRQFTGVLAHEFGHFTQGSGMRLTYVVRSVQAWFARVVYERDAWDERLVRWSQLPLREVQGIFWMTQFCVWLARRVLWALMYVGHAVSCFMLRQMEFDADRCEARVAGSETFVATAERLQILSVAWQRAMADTRHLMVDGHLADNICELLLANVSPNPRRGE